MFLKISPALENTCVAGLQACNFIKMSLQHKHFPVKFLRTPCSTEQFWRLLFKISNSNNLFKYVFVTDLEQIPFFLKSHLNINNFAVLPLLNNLNIKQNLVEIYFSLSISLFFRLEQSFSCFH